VAVSTSKVPLSAEHGLWRHELLSWSGVLSTPGQEGHVRHATYSGTDPSSFWARVQKINSSSLPLVVVACDPFFTFTSLGLWDEIVGPGWRVSGYAISHETFTVRLRKGKRTVRLIGTDNFYRLPAYDLARCVGLTLGSSPHAPADWDHSPDTEAVRLESCLRSMEAVSRIVCDSGAKRFPSTAASLAFGLWQRCFLTRRLMIHANTDALALERAALVGGRCEVYKMGRVSGPVFAMDVNSFYPFLLTKTPLPYRLRRVCDYLLPRDLAKLIGSYHCIAEVVVDTRQSELPTIHRSQRVFARGVFDTTLAHAELARALAEGAVLKVGRVALYNRHPILARAAEHCLSQRQQAAARGDWALASCWKLVGNSLWGKFCQRTPQWRDRPDIQAIAAVAQWWHRPRGSATAIHCRSLGGRTQVQGVPGEWNDSFPAVGACLTSRARVVMDCVKAHLFDGQLYYQDTDSLHVSEAGLAQLRQACLCDESAPGKLKVQHRAASATYFGLRNYRLGEERFCLGMPADAREIRDNVFERSFETSAEQLFERRGLSAIEETRKEIRYVQRFTSGVVGPEGWVSPWVLPCT
jgi:hypothetical protein